MKDQIWDEYNRLLSIKVSYFATKQIQNGYLGLTNPLSNLKNLAPMMDKLSNLQRTAGDCEQERPYLQALGQGIFSEVLIKYVNHVLKISPYFELTNSDRQLLQIEQVCNGDHHCEHSLSVRAVELLRKSLALLNLAIAQESLFAGGILVQPIWEDLQTAPQASPDRMIDETCAHGTRAQNAACLFAENNFHTELKKNLAIYVIQRKLKESKKAVLAYHVARAVTREKGLLTAVLPGLLFEWSEEGEERRVEIGSVRRIIEIPQGWSMKLGYSYISLPDSNEILSGRLYYRSEMEKLIETRGQVISALAEIEMRRHLSREERIALNQAVLELK